MKKLTIILAAASIFAADAQDINKEITLDKEIIPELRAATRLNVGPEVVQPEIKHNGLQLSDRDLTVNIPPYMRLLGAAPTLNAITTSPYDGYVRLGYFPAYNLGLSAGYQVLNDSVNVLNVYGQFNGHSYKRSLSQPDAAKVSDNTGRIGAAYTHWFNRYQSLGINLDALYSATKLTPGSETADEYADPLKNNAFGLGFNATWRSGTETENYYAGIAIDYFANDAKQDNAQETSSLKAIKQGLYNLKFGIGYHGFSIDATAGLNNIDNYNYIFDPASASGSKSAFNLTAIPAYTFGSEKAGARIGVRVDYISLMGKNFNIAPDVRAFIVPSNFFSASLSVTGKTDINYAGRLYDICHFMNPAIAYEASTIPANAQLNLSFGPFKGAWIEVEAAYAVTRDWLMPCATYYGNIYLPADMKGWRAGAYLKYEYGKLLKAHAGISFAPQKQERGWFEWRDRAKQVIDIDVTVTPIPRLDINAGWQLRSKRAQSVADTPADISLVSLRNLSNLYAGVTYRFTDRFNIFLNFNNILNKKYQLLCNVPAQQLSGLAGISYLF